MRDFLFRQVELDKLRSHTELSSRCMKGSNSFDIGSIVISMGPNFSGASGLGTFRHVHSHDNFESVEFVPYGLSLFPGLNFVSSLLPPHLHAGRLEFDPVRLSKTDTHRKSQHIPEPTGSTKNQWNDDR